MGNIPSSERARAQDMLRTVASEIGFGAFQSPKRLIVLTAQRLGGNFGLNGKRGNVNDISKDILAYRIPGRQPQLVDVLIDSGGENKLSWSELEYPQPAGAVWIDPTSQTAPEPPVPGPPGEPGDGGDPFPPAGGGDSGIGMPKMPSNSYPEAIEVAKKVYNEMVDKLGTVTKGLPDEEGLPTEDTVLPEDVVEAMRRSAAVMAGVAANIAIGISKIVAGQPNAARKLTQDEYDALMSQLQEGFSDVNPGE
jgi:hypothetical protein